MNVQKRARELKMLFNTIINGALALGNDGHINKEKLEAVLVICCGKDKRTINRHLDLLKMFGYIQPINKYTYKIFKTPIIEKTLEEFERNE